MPKSIPQKIKFWCKVWMIQNLIFVIFFENIISGMQLIYILPHLPVDIIRFLKKISDFLAVSLKANKN